MAGLICLAVLIAGIRPARERLLEAWYLHKLGTVGANDLLALEYGLRLRPRRAGDGERHEVHTGDHDGIVDRSFPCG